MTTSLVLTVIGRDRPGLVSALSDQAAAFGANWLESRMAHLAGHFAGIVLVEVADARVEPLLAALRGLDAMGLRVEATRTEASPAAPGRLIALQLVGQDKPGIVRDVSRALAGQGVSIESFESEVVSGAMSGEAMFRARAQLRVPAAVPVDALRRAMEALANELMVDLELGELAAVAQ
jgi:glycine cleavage system regulatory protein